MTKKKVTASVRNQHGIEIMKCCGSCQFRVVEDGARICVLQQKRVLKTGCCDDWKLGDRMQMAGHRRGRIKCKDYYAFVLQTRLEEQRAIEAGELKEEQQLKRKAIRKRYVKAFGHHPFIKI